MPAVGTAIAGFLVSGGVAAGAAAAIGSFAANLLMSVALSALQTALVGQQEGPPPAGIKTRHTTVGDSTPQSLIFGTYATAGNHMCPPMTHGSAGGTPNAYMTYVLDVSDAPVGGLQAIWINDEKVTLGPVEPAGSFYPFHQRVTTGQYADLVWVRFYDGMQTAASDSLTSMTGQERPWTSDMIGRGVAYAIIRFKFDDEVWRGQPAVLLEVNGIGFYDPRKDSTAGGSGPQRWGNRATYTPSDNPAVQIYNILRGITLEDGSRWGGETEAADLPTANWFAAMNECDLTVDGEKQYRASTEVRVGPEDFGGNEPAAVIEELLRCCSGQISEFGGVWKMRAGPVGMPVMVLTPDDIIISESQTSDPFPGLQDTYNAVHAQYPEPAEKWVSKEAPPRFSAAYEAQDQGRRLPASIALGACPYPKQVQRLMLALLEDNRRNRREAVTLAPDYAVLEPLDAVAWTDPARGYSAKVFEINGAGYNLRSLCATFQMRERDPADYAWVPGSTLPSTVTPPTTPPIAPQAVPGWSVSATTVNDASGTSRRPAILLGWEPDQPGVRGIAYEVRVVGRTELAAQGSTQNVKAGGIIVVEGVLPATQMQARARLVTNRKTVWSSWITVTTAAVYVGDSDFEGGIRKLFRDQGMSAIEYLAALPSTGNWPNRTVFLTTDGKLYRWNGSAWKAVVEEALAGVLDETYFAAGIKFPKVVSSLPATGTEGDLVTLSTTGLLYRWHADAWTAGVPAAQINGQLVQAQIAVGAVGADQIATNGLVARHFAVTDFTNYAADDQIQDPASWSGIGVNVTHGPNYGLSVAAAQSRGAWSVAPNGATPTIILSKPAPAKPAEQFRASGRIASTGSGFEAYALIQFLDMTNALIGGAIFSPVKSTGAWETVEVATAIAPAGTAYVQFGYHVPASKYGGATIIFSAPELRRKLGGNAVIDGTLTGDKLVANTITAGLLATSGLITFAAQITNGLIDTAHIKNLSVDTIKIKDGAISRNWAAALGSSVTLVVKAETAASQFVVTVAGEARRLLAGGTLPAQRTWAVKFDGSDIITRVVPILESAAGGGSVTYYCDEVVSGGNVINAGTSGNHTLTVSSPNMTLSGVLSVVELKK